MCAWTCRNMHRRAHTWKKVASNGSDICIQPALVIFHPIWFMHIFQLWLPPPPATATPLPCLPQVCLVRCLGPLCVRMLMTAIYLAGFTAATIKNLWFLRWPVFTCYTASYIAYTYIPCAYQLAVPTESVTNWKLKVENSYLKSADFSCSELLLRDIVDRY